MLEESHSCSASSFSLLQVGKCDVGHHVHWLIPQIHMPDTVRFPVFPCLTQPEKTTFQRNSVN